MSLTAPGHTMLHTISSKLPYLSPSLRLIAEFIVTSPEEALPMTISELADRTGVAESSVSRFVRELGVPSYKALNRGIAEALFVSRSAEQTPESVNQLVYEGVARGDDVESIVGKIERSSIQALQQTVQRQNIDAIEQAVSYIDAARTLIFVCMGSSSIAAEEAVMRFTRAGRKCLLFRDQSVQIMLMSIVDKDDVVIAISDSGQTTSVIQATRLARQRGARTVVITSEEDAPIVGEADVVLFTSSVPSGGELYGESVTSKWGQILVIDILYAAFAAGHYDETTQSLRETYRNAIRQSRGN